MYYANGYKKTDQDMFWEVDALWGQYLSMKNSTKFYLMFFFRTSLSVKSSCIKWTPCLTYSLRRKRKYLDRYLYLTTSFY